MCGTLPDLLLSRLLKLKSIDILPHDIQLFHHTSTSEKMADMGEDMDVSWLDIIGLFRRRLLLVIKFSLLGSF